MRRLSSRSSRGGFTGIIPATAPSFFFNVIVYAIIAMIVRKKARVALGLCQEHTRKRRIAIGLSFAGVLASILLIGSAMVLSPDSPEVIAASGALRLLPALIFAVVGTRIAYPQHISATQVRLKGCGEAFLNSLPDVSTRPSDWYAAREKHG